jgi:hypothetical protein
MVNFTTILKTCLTKKINKLLGMVQHACDPRTQEAKQEDREFETSLGYIAKPVLKNKIKQLNK